MPAWLAFSVIRLLEEHFPRQISYEFTAGMEDVLDEIAAGHKDRVTELQRVLLRLRAACRACTTWSPSSARSTPASWRRSRSATPELGINLRVGRYGPYLEGPDDEGNPTGKRANVPEDLPPDELTLEKAKELFANPAGEEIQLGSHPETGLEVVAKNGRYGPYVTEVLPEDAPKNAKPRTGSLFKSMSLDTITLDDALKLLSLPRVVGADPERRGDHRAERPLRALPQEGHRLPVADRPRTSCSRSASTRRCGSTPSPSSAAGPPRPRRSRSSATTRSPASRSW